MTATVMTWTGVLCASALLWIAQAPTARAVSLPEATIPYNCGVQLKGNNNSAADLDKIQALGLKFVRRGFVWEAVEKTKGTYDFSAYDRLVKDCNDRGLLVLGCMVFDHKLYGQVTTEAGREGYARFAAALAVHFKDQNVIWEIWNEPNVRTFWGKQSTGIHNSTQFADEYVALVKATVPVMKKANPACFVMAGSVSGLWSASYQWQQFCFERGILRTGIDAWSVHPYSTRSPEDVMDGYEKVRLMMVKNGAPRDFTMLNSERGYPLGKAEGYSGGDPKLSREFQAWHLVRQYLIDLASGVRLTNWYEWSGKEGFSLYQEGEPLPVFNACKVMLQQLDGYHVDKRIKLASDRDFALRLVNTRTGAVKLVVWTAPPPEEGPDLAKPHAVDIPVDATGTLNTCQIYGQAGAVEVKNSAITLTLTGAPQYVTVRAAQ